MLTRLALLLTGDHQMIRSQARGTYLIAVGPQFPHSEAADHSKPSERSKLSVTVPVGRIP